MAKKYVSTLPTIYLDEHASFMRPSFTVMRVIEISKTRYKGIDERNFIAELYRLNGILITSDRDFAEEISENNQIKHAGIVYVPKELSKEEKLHFGEIICAYIKGECKNGVFRFRNMILFPGHDGLRSVFKGKSTLDISWDWFGQELDWE